MPRGKNIRVLPRTQIYHQTQKFLMYKINSPTQHGRKPSPREERLGPLA